jgi:cytoskeletal protein CcmA (bactofilin family)
MKKKDQAVTFLGKNTAFEGKLSFQGTMRIDGHFKGDISNGGHIIVGEEGLIEGDMHISYIVISGEVQGNIIADQRVDIHAPGKVFGDIQAPAVVIDEGVIFEGTTRMYQAKESDPEKLNTIGSDRYSGSPPPTLCAIYGIVTDQSTGRPINNAEIICEGIGKRKARTNASGYYELINLEDGKWKIKIKAKGFKKGTSKVEISGEGTYEQNCELRPK